MYNPYPENTYKWELYNSFFKKSEDTPPLELMQIVEEIVTEGQTIPPDKIAYQQISLF